MESQPMQPHHTTFIIATTTVIIIFLGGLFLYLSFKSNKKVTPAPAATPTPTVAPTNAPSFPSSENSKQLIPKAISNPVGDLPKTNPFSAKTNPFKDSYKNPFE